MAGSNTRMEKIRIRQQLLDAISLLTRLQDIDGVTIHRPVGLFVCL